MTAADAFMNELADLVAERVLTALPRQPIIQPRLLNVEDVATMIGRTEDAVRSLLKRGQLKNASPDGRVQVDVKDIEVWITNNKR
jgi:translation elongation factor EF-Tu-like GTPase